MIIYAETGLGFCIKEAKSVESGRRAILREVGTFKGVQVCREATKEDVFLVGMVGGYIPEKLLKKLNKMFS